MAASRPRLGRIRTLGVAAALAVLATALGGCAGFVKSTVSSFHKMGPADRGKSFVVAPLDPGKVGSLEFDSYAKLVSQHLSARGFRLAISGQQEPDYVVFLDYGIGSGQTVTGSVPIYGQTGGGYTYQSGTVSSSRGYGTYSGYAYSPPTYGVVGQAPYARTLYTRHLVIEIADAGKLKSGTVEKLYEARAVSTGRSAALPLVVPVLIRAVLQDFPGQSGQTRSVVLPLE